MKQLTVKELFAECMAEIAKGNGNQKIVISHRLCDDKNDRTEGNETDYEKYEEIYTKWDYLHQLMKISRNQLRDLVKADLPKDELEKAIIRVADDMY